MKFSYQGWSNISSYTYPSGNFQTLGSNWRWLWPLKSILLETNLHLLEHQKVLKGGFEKVGPIRPPQQLGNKDLCKFSQSFLAMTGVNKGSLGLQLASFIAWAGFTFSSHYTAKLWLNKGGRFHDVLVLSILQIATGLVIGTLFCLLGRRLRELKVNFSLLFLGACHSYGTLLTNSRYGHGRNFFTILFDGSH